MLVFEWGQFRVSRFFSIESDFLLVILDFLSLPIQWGNYVGFNFFSWKTRIIELVIILTTCHSMLMTFQPISANFSLFSWLENQLNPTGFPGFHCLKNPLNSACFLGRKINIIQLVFLTEKSDIFLANISANMWVFWARISADLSF